MALYAQAPAHFHWVTAPGEQPFHNINVWGGRLNDLEKTNSCSNRHFGHHSEKTRVWVRDRIRHLELAL